MAYLHALQRTLTLQASLDALTRLGDGYALAGAGREWRARDLLEWLQNDHPTLLEVPVALVLSGDTTAGAILDVDRDGEPIPDRPLYRIEQRLPTVFRAERGW